MKKLRIVSNKLLEKDIKTLKKREPFTKLSDKEFLTITLTTISYCIISMFTLSFDIAFFAALFPLLGVTGFNIYFLREIINSVKRKNAKKNIDSVVKTLNIHNVKVNSNDLINCTVCHNDTKDDNIHSNCYLFLDRNNKINGLYEERDLINRNNNYYLLKEELGNYNVKKKVLTKNTIKWR